MMQIINELWKSAKLWDALVCEYDIDVDDAVVFLTSNSYEDNECTINYFGTLRYEKGYNRFLVVSKDHMVQELLEKQNEISCILITMSEEDMLSICKLYSIHRFSTNIYFSSYQYIADVDAMQLVDINGITKEEVIALGLLKIAPETLMSNVKNLEPRIKYRRINSEQFHKHVPLISEDTSDEERIKTAINQLIEDGSITKRNQLYVFGVTKSAEKVLSFLKDFKKIGIIDNSVHKENTTICGKRVCYPKDVLLPYDENIRIIISSPYYIEMAEQLAYWGYELGKHVYVVWRNWFYIDTSDRSIAAVEKRLLQGRDVYFDLKKDNKQRHLYICPYPGTGDIYLCCMYLQKQIQESGILVVPSVACKKIASLFGIEAICISKNQMMQLVHYVRYYGTKEKDASILNDGVDQNIVPRLRGYKGMDFNSMFQHLVFHSEEKMKKCNLIQESADDIFIECGLKKGKTILLSPYANTVYDVDKSFWMELVNILTELGFDVCTNVATPDEKAIPNTRAVFISYSKLISFLDDCAGFIGLRSGLCDLISGSKVKMALIYPKGITMVNSSALGYFGLYNMGLREEGVLELEFDNQEQRRILHDILKFITEEEKE